MRKPLRIYKTWLVALAITAIALGALISVLVFATGDSRLTIAPYADVIRFEAEASVDSLQITVFDLSGRVLWDSGVVSSRIIDWGRTNEWGERLAYGAYLYQAVGWDVDGSVVLERSGKLVLLPGDKVQLQAAPAVSDLAGQDKAPPVPEASPTVQPMGLSDTGIFGKVGIGTTDPRVGLEVSTPVVPYKGEIILVDSSHSSSNTSSAAAVSGWGNDIGSGATGRLWVFGSVSSGNHNIALYNDKAASIGFWTNAQEKVTIDKDGNLGIGTTNPGATLEVHGSATNLLALYDPVAPTDPKFRVEKDGDVYADGTYYCSDGQFHTGYADVAERINTSEWVEAGNVVEIDSDHPGFFRKSSSPYSTKVTGIISTFPGVILGNSFNEATDDWEDNRPVLAIAGRVPLQVTAENGPIRIGDLLVSSSIPGVAMKGDPKNSIGAVVGKAMEPLKEGTGTIVVQVMLR